MGLRKNMSPHFILDIRVSVHIACSISSASIFLSLTFSVWVKEIIYFPALIFARIVSTSIYRPYPQSLSFYLRPPRRFGKLYWCNLWIYICFNSFSHFLITFFLSKYSRKYCLPFCPIFSAFPGHPITTLRSPILFDSLSLGAP